MNKAFVISTVTAIALGYAGGFASNGLVAKAQIPIKIHKHVMLKLGEAAKGSWEQYIENQFCSKVEEAFGLEQDSCSAELLKGEQICVKWEDFKSEYYISSDVELGGNWSVGEPQ